MTTPPDRNSMTNTKSSNGKSTTPKSLTTTSEIEGENGWLIVNDSFGDWRGVNEALGLRTRLKRGNAERGGLEWVKHDIAAGRLQRRVGGEWVDRIDGRGNPRDRS